MRQASGSLTYMYPTFFMIIPNGTISKWILKKSATISFYQFSQFEAPYYKTLYIEPYLDYIKFMLRARDAPM